MTTLTRSPLPYRPARPEIVSLKPQKPNNPEAGRLKSTRPGVFIPARAGGGGRRPRGLWLGARAAVVVAAARPGAGATSRVPGPCRRELGERRAARLAGRPLAPPAARRDPPTPRPPAAARTAHSPAAARCPAPARRRAERPGPRRRPQSAGPSDTQPRSGCPAAAAGAGGLAGAG